MYYCVELRKFIFNMNTLQNLYDLGISLGMDNDPRTKKTIKELLSDEKKRYDKLPKNKKKFFDQQRFNHPYSDSRILFGTGQEKIKKLLVGVDIETPEILLAKELSRSGKQIDAIMAHHPEGRGLLDLTGVMKLQETVFESLGVTPNIAEKLLDPRIEEVARSLHPVNVFRATKAAELLNMPFFCIHTPADNCAYRYFENNICNKDFKNLGEVIEEIIKIPEFEMAVMNGNPPKIFSGSEKSKPGKIVATEMTGGTSGSEKIYAKLAQAGVGTVLSMHTGEKHRQEAEKNHINIIVCSHMSSDSLGINHVCDLYEKSGVEIIPCSGFYRVSRNKK